MSWLTRTHPDYDAAADRLSFTLAHYEGDLYEPVTAKLPPAENTVAGQRTALGLKGTPFLHRHGQGESEAAFTERRLVSKAKPHFPFIVDSLSGQLFAQEGKAQRRWTQTDADKTTGVLGTPDDTGSHMARLWEDADGTGTNWETLWMGLAPRLVAVRRWGVYVDGVRVATTAEDGTVTAARDARVVMVHPADVLDWHESGGEMQWVKLRERGETEREPDGTHAAETTYLVLRMDGWTRYREGDEGAVEEVETGTYTYRTLGEGGRSTIPFRWATVPVKRDLGYAIAKSANAIMNLESNRDFRLWTACVNRLHLTTEQSVKDVREGMRAGDSLIITSGDGAKAEYINPSQEPALAATTVLGKEIEELYHVAYRSYSDAARQATATEIAQDVAAGVEAFLVLCAAAMDEAENWAFGILEQTYGPDKSAQWGAAYITRSRSFQPVIPDAVATGLRSRYFEGAPVPVGEKAVKQAAQMIAELDGLEPDPDELGEAVREHVERPADGSRILTPRQTARVGATDDPLGVLDTIPE